MTITIEKLEYIVGIDFGHGETAAWVVPVDETDTRNHNGYALLLKRSNEIQQRAIPSEVYLKDGVYSIDNKIGSSIITQMKNKELKNNEKNKPYKEYIKLVVLKLLELNPILKKEKRNFILCMAAPTGWKEFEKKEYLNFCNEAIADLGLRFEWIINESDAAFFSRKQKYSNDEDCTLVIDYGSSTIDYTLMMNGRKVSDNGWSSDQLGAHCIEDAMINAGQDPNEEGHDSHYEETLTETNKYFCNNNLTHVDSLEWIKHNGRMVKEYFYSTYAEGNDLFDFNYNCAVEVSGRRNEETLRLRFSWYASMDKITQSYRNEVERDFNSLREKILKKNKIPNTIILSGGASIMYWVRPLVKKIFPESNIIDDGEPKFVVAEGIALYARAQYKAVDDLVKKINEVDFAAMYKEADAFATRSALSIQCNSKMESIVKCAPISADGIRTKFIDIVKSLNENNPEFRNFVYHKFNESLSSNISKKVIGVIKEAYNIDIKMNDLKITKVNTMTMGFHTSCFVPGGCYYVEISRAIRDAIFVTLGWSLNWTKLRNEHETYDIACSVKAAICKYRFEDQVCYPEDEINAFASQICDIAKNEAIRIFYEKQLFTTTFSA